MNKINWSVVLLAQTNMTNFHCVAMVSVCVCVYENGRVQFFAYALCAHGFQVLVQSAYNRTPAY